MTPTEVLKMLKSKIETAGLNKCNYAVETSDIEAINQALLLYDVSGSLPPDELEKSLGSANRQFIIWHDGGEWLISLKGKEHEQCKTLREWICGTDR
jgi:hypothetical protein